MEWLKLIPAALIGLVLLAQLIWQGYRVAKAPKGLLRLNALMILGTAALMFAPPYDGYESLSTALTRALFCLPFLAIAVITDPGWYRLLPLAHLVFMLFVITALASSMQ